MRMFRLFRIPVAPWIGLLTLLSGNSAFADDPPAVNPFGPRSRTPTDAVSGFVEFSDKTVVLGKIYLTRDTRLKIYDESAQRQREIPIRVVRKIECKIKREWMEKEWRFKENANDEKLYTGRTYPAREYIHTITIQGDREITGPISAIVYVQEQSGKKRKRFLLLKRQKGDIGKDLESLIYLRRIEFGEKAMEEGKRLGAERYEPEPKKRESPRPAVRTSR